MIRFSDILAAELLLGILNRNMELISLAGFLNQEKKGPETFKGIADEIKKVSEEGIQTLNELDRTYHFLLVEAFEEKEKTVTQAEHANFLCFRELRKMGTFLKGGFDSPADEALANVLREEHQETYRAYCASIDKSSLSQRMRDLLVHAEKVLFPAREQ